MTTIKAVIRNGCIEIPEPINLPDGTVLAIPIPDLPVKLPVFTMKKIQKVPKRLRNFGIRWYDALEPVQFTPEERAAWDTACREQKEFELAQWEKRSQMIEGQFP